MRTPSSRYVCLLTAALSVAAGGTACERAKPTSQPAPSLAAPAARPTGQAFEMRISFDANGHEVARRCVVMVPQAPIAGKYKVAEEKPVACPDEVVVTAGTKGDPLGIRGENPR